MLIMVGFDISDDRRRYAVSKILKSFGERVQRSVFECRISEGQLHELRGRLSVAIDSDEDSVRMYSFCSACDGKIEMAGTMSSVEEDEGFYIV